MSDILIRKEGHAGRITLNRPQVLNALSHDQVKAMIPALQAWSIDDGVKLVVIDAVGGKSFCSGGDIQNLYKNGREQPEFGRQFWREEYSLNALVYHYPKPYVALMDGYDIGGGIGISALGSHRIVTERSMVLMPETSIGFIPDVGGSRILTDAPGFVGFYLGLCAQRMTAADAIFVGFADHYVPSADLPQLSEAMNAGDATVIEKFARTPAPSKLLALRPEIDGHFGKASLMEIMRSLEADDSAFAKEAAVQLRRVSPFAAACCLEAFMRLRKTDTIEAALAMEYRYAHRSLGIHDFFEGIRAVVIDKDKNPKFQPARIEDVDAAQVAAMLAPLGAEEWKSIL